MYYNDEAKCAEAERIAIESYIIGNNSVPKISNIVTTRIV